MLQTTLGAAAALLGGPTWLALDHSPALARSRKKMVFPWVVPYDPASFASLKQHAHLISHVSPTWYAMRADLSITARVDPAVDAFARSHDIRLIPLIKNDGFSPQVAHDILVTPQQRAGAADTITALVVDNDYDGINVDFEGPFGASRDRYSDFIHRLAVKLHGEGKVLSVDVVPQLKPASSYPDTSWAAPYDYAALGQACDAVMMMCYSYSDKKPGSLSPLWWLREATYQALTQLRPAKLVIGMAFYGRHWIVNGKHTTHSDLKQAQALDLLAQSGAKLQRPPRDATPRFTWQDSDGEHIVHFEDEKSLAAKLKVVQSTGAAGAAFWRLGQEKPSQWNVIRRGLVA